MLIKGTETLVSARSLLGRIDDGDRAKFFADTGNFSSFADNLNLHKLSFDDLVWI